jgi:IS30 family transposase
LWRVVLSGLQKGWSPELIAGRWRLKRPASRLCAETIYRFIYSAAQQSQQWWLYLPFKRRKRGRPSRPGSRLARCDWGLPLSERPPQADTREQAGHWEIDTMCFSQPGRVVVHLVERVSRYGLALLMASREAEAIADAVLRKLAGFPQHLKRSLSADRGSEFSQLSSRKLTLYLCDPYSAWQKGMVENANGLLRRYLPRCTDQTTLNQEELDDIRNEINNRPMKVLGYKTPLEVLRSLASQAVALHL